jgi:hypothetical protein
MSETCPASGASNPQHRGFAKSDDGTSSPGRRASRDNPATLVRCGS